METESKRIYGCSVPGLVSHRGCQTKHRQRINGIDEKSSSWLNDQCREHQTNLKFSFNSWKFIKLCKWSESARRGRKNVKSISINISQQTKDFLAVVCFAVIGFRFPSLIKFKSSAAGTRKSSVRKVLFYGRKMFERTSRNKCIVKCSNMHWLMRH